MISILTTLLLGLSLLSRTTNQPLQIPPIVATQPFQISGHAMAPTLLDKQYIIIDTNDKNFSRGDIIVFKYPKDPSSYFVKRIIGLPGETIEIKNEQIFIDKRALDERGYLLTDVKTYGPAGEIKVGADEYYVLGDNRTASSDSRIWGNLTKELIVGKYIKVKK
jgi:signal peptidase I